MGAAARGCGQNFGGSKAAALPGSENLTLTNYPIMWYDATKQTFTGTIVLRFMRFSFIFIVQKRAMLFESAY